MGGQRPGKGVDWEVLLAEKLEASQKPSGGLLATCRQSEHSPDSKESAGSENVDLPAVLPEAAQ